MNTWTLHSPEEVSDAIHTLRQAKLPVTVTIKPGAPRSVEQNRLQRLWVNEAAKQLGDCTPEELRAYCKLHFGVTILRNESDDFRREYDRVVRPMSYEDKLAIMAIPLDLPVTRLMTTEQKARYLDAMYQHLTVERGCRLTEPR